MPDRIQGTDGIRRDVLPQRDPTLAGLSPWEAFAERGVITDAFLEGYAFAFVREFLPPGAEVVVGWDPRDPKRIYTGAVVRGIRKAGAAALVAGIIPTPGVPLYMVSVGAAAGLMVTASHNPPEQNGVKIFLPPGRKLLPDDDRRLTRAVAAVDWETLAGTERVGRPVNVYQPARGAFRSFHVNPANSWLVHGAGLSDAFNLVFDPAHGALTPSINSYLRFFGFRGADQAVVSNPITVTSRVNERSGVAELEGHPRIPLDEIAADRRWEGYSALEELARRARTRREVYEGGNRLLAGMVFDADGDRFFLLVYDPFADDIVVLSGDEVAILQAEYLAATRGHAVRDYLSVNTVESDLAMADAAAARGFRPLLKPVGDKWILEEAWRAAEGKSRAADVPFAVGYEETGHAITFGDLEKQNGAVVPFAAGNGFKSALNTLASVLRLRAELRTRELYEKLRAPFERGYKKTNYVYFTRKESLLKRGPAYDEMHRLIPQTLAAQAPSLERRELAFAEEPDLLYWAGHESGRQVLGVFCRNSGTEDKSALYVRATVPYARAAAAVEEELYPRFYALMKDENDARARAQLAWLHGDLKPDDPWVVKITREIEGLIRDDGLTPRGRAVRETLRAAGRL